MPKTNIRLLTKEDLLSSCRALGEPAFRAKQIYEWLWTKGVGSFDDMTNLSKSLREKLADQFDILQIREHARQISTDGTIKIRFQLHDGHLIESVLIPVKKDKRFTLCVSTQVGCSLSCSFCATGKMGLKRNLSFDEIFDQYILVDRICQEIYDLPLTNIVYMGMGEPLLNFNQVVQSIEKISDPAGLNFSNRRITISTAGIAKMIRKVADTIPKVNIALSLHAPDDVKRNEIMAINESNSIEALMEALSYYHEVAKGDITFEYILLKNFNDQLQDADLLANLCHQFRVKVNLIEYNPIGDGLFHKSHTRQADRFAARLAQKKVNVTLRRSRGEDIDAACGQLANKDQ